MPSQERFRRAPSGARPKRCPVIEISTFRCEQQPKLREISCCLLSLSHSCFANGAILPDALALRQARRAFNAISLCLGRFSVGLAALDISVHRRCNFGVFPGSFPASIGGHEVFLSIGDLLPDGCGLLRMSGAARVYLLADAELKPMGVS